MYVPYVQLENRESLLEFYLFYSIFLFLLYINFHFIVKYIIILMYNSKFSILMR